jgi:phosphohistidine phosphatase
MDLLLWRHAEAEPGEPDAARPLTDKGRKQAERIAAWLDARLPADTRVLVSPAERARQTADALARPSRVVEALAPGATVSALLAAVGWPKASAPVLVVGHQPTLGEVAAYLLSGEPQPWSIRKGAVWWIGAPSHVGRAPAVLRAVIGPDLVRSVARR